MESIEKIFLVPDKEKRYDQFIAWITAKVFKNNISILERYEFSEKRKVRNNNKKLIAVVIYSPDPESSAWRGPAITIRIFEKQDTEKWTIDLICKPFMSTPTSVYKDLNFSEFINDARMDVMYKLIHG